jgi:lysyl-tRNA synthetase class I
MYNPKLYVMKKSFLNSLTYLNSTKYISLYINNQAMIKAVQDNKGNREACRKAIYHVIILQNQGPETKIIGTLSYQDRIGNKIAN